jgi:putative nucleotidyltransferase with HDIG domain
MASARADKQTKARGYMIQMEGQPTKNQLPMNSVPWALDGLPPFPLIATRLLVLLAQEDPDITEVGRIISAEPVYAARVLQMANSPLFALRAQVKTLSHAIVLLGLARIRSITVTRALGDFVAPVLNVRALRVCWQNSLAGALVAEKLARPCRMDTDFAYVAGLVRDIGRLALLVKHPESFTTLLTISGEQTFDLMTTERKLFDIDHCQAGAWMIERMPLPPELIEVVAHHHDLPDGKAFRMVHLVRVADRMADTLGFAVAPPAPPLEFAEVLRELPEPARSGFDYDPADLRLEIETKIQSWG